MQSHSCWKPWLKGHRNFRSFVACSCISINYLITVVLFKRIVLCIDLCLLSCTSLYFNFLKWSFRGRKITENERRQYQEFREPTFNEKSFSRKKVKNCLGNWGAIVSCILLSMRRIVESRLDYSGRGKTEQDVSF